MALSLSTPGSCCGHNLNMHIREQDERLTKPCLVCECPSFEPDLCHYGHIPGCKHLVDPQKRCQARCDRPSFGRVRCIEEEHPRGGFHRAQHPTLPGTFVAWPEQEAIYPVGKSDHDKMAERVEVANPDRLKASVDSLSARDTQVGGNHYKKFKIQPWDVIDEYGLTFYAGNALKYLLRAGRKGVALEDLKKARHYLDRMIEIEESK